MHDPSLQAVRRAAAFESTVLENGDGARAYDAGLYGRTRGIRHEVRQHRPCFCPGRQTGGPARGHRPFSGAQNV